MLESYEEYSMLEEKAGILRTYVEDTELFNEDAAKQAAEKKQSLVKKAWDAVINFLKTIKEKVYEAIDKIKCRINPNAKVYVIPKEYADKGNISKLQQCIEKIKSITSSTPFKAVIAITIAIAGVCALYKIKKQGKEINELNTNLSHVMKDLAGADAKAEEKIKDLQGRLNVASVADGFAQQEIQAAYKRERKLEKQLWEKTKENESLQKKYDSENTARATAELRLQGAETDYKLLEKASKISESDYANLVKKATTDKNVIMVTDKELKQLASIYQTSVDRLIHAAQVAHDIFKIDPDYVAENLCIAADNPSGRTARAISKALRETGAYPKNAYDIEEAGPDNGNISGAFTKLRSGINDLARTLKSIGDDLLKLRMKANK